MKGGSSSGGSQEVKQTSEPWPAQQPYLKDLYKLAQTAYGQTPKTNPPQQTVAPFRPEEIAAQEYGKELALGLQGAGAPMIDLASSMLAGDWLRAESNPYLQDAVQAFMRPSITAFQEEIYPMIRSEAIAQGAYGGNREGIMAATAADKTFQSMMDTSSQVALDNYWRERQNMMTLAPQLMQMGIGFEQIPGQLMESVGQTRRGMDDAMLKQAWDLWSANQNTPWIGLDKYSQIVQGGGYPGGTSTQTQSGGGGSGVFGGALGGGLLGALAGNEFDDATGWALAPWAGGGAVLGGLAGLFG